MENTPSFKVRTFEAHIAALKVFAAEACKMKLLEMFPDTEERYVAELANNFVCHCLPGIGLFFNGVTMYTATYNLPNSSTSERRHNAEIMIAFCLQVKNAVNIYYEAIENGTYTADDFFKHTIDGQG